jgi:hypothetical protein
MTTKTSELEEKKKKRLQNGEGVGVGVEGTCKPNNPQVRALSQSAKKVVW